MEPINYSCKWLILITEVEHWKQLNARFIARNNLNSHKNSYSETWIGSMLRFWIFWCPLLHAQESSRKRRFIAYMSRVQNQEVVLQHFILLTSDLNPNNSYWVTIVLDYSLMEQQLLKKLIKEKYFPVKKKFSLVFRKLFS
jgi:hypothetical protein